MLPLENKTIIFKTEIEKVRGKKNAVGVHSLTIHGHSTVDFICSGIKLLFEVVELHYQKSMSTSHRIHLVRFNLLHLTPQELCLKP